MAQNKDPYQVLHVSPAADQETIREAYRNLARRYHPDLNPAPEAALHMQDLNWAYDLLSDPARRAAYHLGQDLDAAVYSVYRPDYNRNSYEPPSRQNRLFQNLGRLFLLFVLLAGWVLSPFLSEGSDGFAQLSRLLVYPTATSSISSVNELGLSSDSCTSWSNISLNDLGRQICVFGTVLSFTPTGPWSLLRFSDGSVDNLIMIDSNLSHNLHRGACLRVMGQVEQQDHHAVILVRSADQLLPCD
jgi:curved DNA-binding protein CbpA